jgi:fructan beta-fructosidase
MKYPSVLFFLVTSSSVASNAQNKETTDPFRLEYKDVYENMHYNQPLRPQVHYTPITGQIGDPTGLIQYKGTYHLFYMYDEWSKRRGDNKNWGHAISHDCIYWEQHPHITNSIIDNKPGSGSGIVDWNNTLGLQAGVEKTMVVFYTDYGRGTSIAFSMDAGKTWIRHKKNPVIAAKKGTGGTSRDPVVFWYKPDQSWRLVQYESPGFAFYKSSTLTEWEFLSKMDGFYECPDIMEMPVDGQAENKKWILIDGNGSYFIGKFDGTKFIKESERNVLGEETVMTNHGNQNYYYTKDFYASQTWKQSYEGDGPFYQLASMWLGQPPTHDRTWSQQLTFPVELTLNTINNQILLCRNPINGIKQLRYDPQLWSNTSVKPGDNLLEKMDGDVFEIISEIDCGTASQIIFDIRGEKATYDVAKQQMDFMKSNSNVRSKNNAIKLRFIIDRNSVEIFANQGEVSVTRLFYPDPANKNLSLTSVGGDFKINKMELYRLESIWLKREQELGYHRNASK